MGLFSSARNRLGIDLGGSQFRIYGEQGLILSEDSVAALDFEKNLIVGFGTEAWVRYHNNPRKYRLIHPVQNGVMSDYSVTKEMIRRFFVKSLRQRSSKPSVTVAVPTGISTVSRHALSDAFGQVGVRDLCFLSASLAAAFGEEAYPEFPNMLFSAVIGQDVTDVGIYACGGVIWNRTEPFGGKKIDYGISRYFHSVHGLIIDMEQAEKIKHHLISVSEADRETVFTVRGRRLCDGVEIVLELSLSDMFGVMETALRPLLRLLQEALRHSGPDMAEELLAKGLLISGGTALLKGLSEWLSIKLGIPVRIGANARENTVKGCFLSEKYRHSLPLLIENGAKYYGKA